MSSPSGGSSFQLSWARDRGEHLLEASRTRQVHAVAQILAENPGLSRTVVDQDGNTPLHYACVSNAAEIVRELLNDNCNPDICDPHGRTPLHWCATRGNVTSSIELLNAGANIEHVDGKGRNAAHHATMHGQTAFLDFLFRRGLDIDIADADGRTPLHWAIFRDETISTRWLVEKGASLETSDVEGMNALHWAAVKGRHAAANFLIDTILSSESTVSLGDMLRKTDISGCTPADLARSNAKKAACPSARRQMGRLAHDLTARGGQKVYITRARRMWRLVWRKHFTASLYPLITFLLVMMEYCSVQPAVPHAVWSHRGFWVLSCSGLLLWLWCRLGDAGILTEPHTREPSVAYGDALLLRKLYDQVVTVGECDADAVSAATGEEMGVMRLCATCRIVKPRRVKHCKLCDVCVGRFDHHCGWTSNCVGAHNHLTFLCFVLTGILAGITWCSIIVHFAFKAQLSLLYGLLFWSVFALIPVIMLIYGCFLLHYQVTLVWSNLTTNEVLNSDRLSYIGVVDGKLRAPPSAATGWDSFVSLARLCRVPHKVRLYLRRCKWTVTRGRRRASSGEGADVAPRLEMVPSEEEGCNSALLRSTDGETRLPARARSPSGSLFKV